MKEKIIQILSNEISTYVSDAFALTSEIIGINHAAEEIEKLINEELVDEYQRGFQDGRDEERNNDRG